MTRLAKYVAIALAASMVAAFAAAMIYLISVNAVRANTEAILFAAAVALGLMPATTVVAAMVAIAYPLLERCRPTLTIPLIVTLAACGGVVVGLLVDGPHVPRERAILACATSFGLVAFSVLAVARR